MDNFIDIIIFELIFNIISNAVIIPLMKFLVNASVKSAGYEYISNKTLLKFLSSPSTVLIILFIFLLASFCKLFEISAVVFYFDKKINHTKTGIDDMIYAGISSCKRAIKKENLVVLLYSLAILPVSEFSIMSDMISSAGVPDVISYYASRKMIFFIIMIFILLILSFVFIKWLFSISYFVSEKQSFSISRKKSSILVKGNFFKTLFSLFLWELCAVFIMLVIIIAFSFSVCILIKLNVLPFDTIKIISSFNKIIISCFSFLSVPFICSFICTECCCRRNRLSETFIYNAGNIKKSNHLSAGIFSIILAFSLFLDIFLSFDIMKNGIGINMEIFNQTQVCAHRGDSANAPENTIPAFEMAIEKNSHWIEIDVQEAMDGTVIVMHDSNFKRTTGINKNVWEINYSEIRKLDAGKSFSIKYKGTQIPVLDEVMKLAKGKIKLNIEIKPSGYEKNLEKSVAEIIKFYDMEDECVVSSFSAESLKKIKAENPDIKTAYIMSVAVGDIKNIPYADAFSINSVFISENLVDSVHSAGKEIYAWTVNTKSEMIKMKEYDVDNIITDNPELALNIINSSEYDNIIIQFASRLFGSV